MRPAGVSLFQVRDGLGVQRRTDTPSSRFWQLLVTVGTIPASGWGKRTLVHSSSRSTEQKQIVFTKKRASSSARCPQKLSGGVMLGPGLPWRWPAHWD